MSESEESLMACLRQVGEEAGTAVLADEFEEVAVRCQELAARLREEQAK